MSEHDDPVGRIVNLYVMDGHIGQPALGCHVGTRAPTVDAPPDAEVRSYIHDVRIESIDGKRGMRQVHWWAHVGPRGGARQGIGGLEYMPRLPRGVFVKLGERHVEDVGI